MTYSTEQVSAYARVTLRQLQYWDEQGIVSPEVSRDGWHRGRQYSSAKATEVFIIGAFLRKGLNMWWVRKHLPKLRRCFGPCFRPDDVVVWDGTKLHRATAKDGAVVLAIAEHAQAACTLVRIPKLIGQGEK